MMQEVRCVKCGKLLCEATGEVKKICPKCKETTHIVVTSQGVINLNKSTPK
jgi:phage FluMu protein Com